MKISRKKKNQKYNYVELYGWRKPRQNIGSSNTQHIVFFFQLPLNKKKTRIVNSFHTNQTVWTLFPAMVSPPSISTIGNITTTRGQTWQNISFLNLKMRGCFVRCGMVFNFLGNFFRNLIGNSKDTFFCSGSDEKNCFTIDGVATGSGVPSK